MAIVIEGRAYIARATITNRSVQAGMPVGATLTTQFSGNVAGVPLGFSPPSESYSFGPEEARIVEATFTVPLGTTGRPGLVAVEVLDPSSNLLASSSEALDIRAAEAQVIYPTDDWTEDTNYPGQQFRLTFLMAGYTGGNLWGKDTCYIQFPALPGGFSQAILTLHLLESFWGYPLPTSPNYPVRIFLGSVLVFVDTLTFPQIITLNVSSLVVPGQMPIISMIPDTPVFPENFLRKYGSIYGPQATWASITLT